MATTSEARALPFFTDLIGQPLSSGFIYIGQAGLDPLAYPAVVTADTAGTVVVAQPVRTTNGHAAQGGALVHLFCPIPYSITILDSAGRLVYTSLNETDPVALAITQSSVQSAATLADLRARSKASTNQVWVATFGMYVYDPTDNTSPESIPRVIVGNDGARYKLGSQYVLANDVQVIGVSSPTAPGGYLGFSDLGNGETSLTNNPGATGGGFAFRTMNAAGDTAAGTTTISRVGDITTTGNVTAGGNVTVSGGTVNLNSAGTRSIAYNTAGSVYQLSGPDNLTINGSFAVNDSRLPSVLATNQQGFGVGSIILTNGSAPIQPGTWVLQVSGLGTSGLAQYVRTA